MNDSTKMDRRRAHGATGVRHRGFRTITAAIVAVACGGCGGRYVAVDMQGMISVDGQEASAGYVTFEPRARDQGKGGMGTIRPDGSYLLRGVPLGEVTFTIAPQKNTGKQIQTVGPAGNKVSTEELVPMVKGGTFGAGQTTLTLEVTPAMAQHDFRLSDQAQ